MRVEKNERSEMREDKRTRGESRNRGGEKTEEKGNERQRESICRRFWLCPKALASLLILLFISPSHFHSIFLSLAPL